MRLFAALVAKEFCVRKIVELWNWFSQNLLLASYDIYIYIYCNYCSQKKMHKTSRKNAMRKELLQLWPKEKKHSFTALLIRHCLSECPYKSIALPWFWSTFQPVRGVIVRRISPQGKKDLWAITGHLPWWPLGPMTTIVDVPVTCNARR
jgi:hypothetical protein